MTVEPVVFEWKMFPGHTTLDLFREVQDLMEKELKVQPAEEIRGPHHLHVDVQRHLTAHEKEAKKLVRCRA